MKPITLALVLVLATASLASTGCGKKAKGLSVDVPVVKVKAKAVVPDDDAFWVNFPSTVAKVAMKSVNKQYMVVRFTARKLGFNNAAKIGFPVLVQDEVQFKTNLYLAKDSTLFISDLGSTDTPKFYRVGSFGAKSIELFEGDTVRCRFDKGFQLDLSTSTGQEGEGPVGLAASMTLRAMPPVMSEPNLFSSALPE